MSATGLEVFDRTLHTTNIWLEEIMEALGTDRQTAWHVLGAVLRTLRDRLPLELSVHLGSQLPMLVRGLYYDQWQPSRQPNKMRALDDFLYHVAEKLADARPVNAQEATRCVFLAVSRHVDRGQVEKVREALPAELRPLWPEDFLAEAPGQAQAQQ